MESKEDDGYKEQEFLFTDLDLEDQSRPRYRQTEPKPGRSFRGSNSIILHTWQKLTESH